jgi:hypothetical protein
MSSSPSEHHTPTRSNAAVKLARDLATIRRALRLQAWAIGVAIALNVLIAIMLRLR